MNGKNEKKATNGNVEKKIADTRKEWSKEWELEKQTEGLDESEKEAKKKTAECGCKYF